MRIINQRPTNSGFGFLITRNLSNYYYNELLELQITNAKVVYPMEDIVEEGDNWQILMQSVPKGGQNVIIY